MAASGEVVLRPRICLDRECRALFFLCSRCDRGQRYCSLACRQQARLRQRRCANRRHQQSPEGRLDHRDRQREYRRRQMHARVTDQGSLSIACSASSSMWTGRSADTEVQQRPCGVGLPRWPETGRAFGCAAGSVAEPAVSSIRFHAFHDEGESILMISPETRAQIRRYFYAEHWKIGTIASELGVILTPCATPSRRSVSAASAAAAALRRRSLPGLSARPWTSIRATARPAFTRWSAIAVTPAAWSSSGAPCLLRPESASPSCA